MSWPPPVPTRGLVAGGFVTTLIESGQQWDAPNGWPPLQWLAIEGARRYGRGDLAGAARDRCLGLNRRTYRATGKMMEKYDVLDSTRPAGGGEYPSQDGFGWSNGVALALAQDETSTVRAVAQLRLRSMIEEGLSNRRDTYATACNPLMPPLRRSPQRKPVPDRGID